MSTNLYVAVGCFIELPKVQKRLEQNKHVCLNEDCVNRKGVNKEFKFCPVCGSVCGDKEFVYETNDFLNWYNFVEENSFNEDEFFWIKEDSVLISNKSRSTTFSELDNNSCFEIDVKYIDMVKKEFEKNHGETIAKINMVLGENLVVKFGVIPYYL